MKKERTLPLHSTPDVPFDNTYAKVYWAYSNLKHLLMHFHSDQSRNRDFKKDIVPSCSVLIHAFGIPAGGGSVTYSLKEEGQYSTAVWDTVLGHEWDKVADGTACVVSLKFKVDKSCSLNFNKNIYVHVALLSNVNYKTMSGYRSHAKEKSLGIKMFQFKFSSSCVFMLFHDMVAQTPRLFMFLNWSLRPFHVFELVTQTFSCF